MSTLKSRQTIYGRTTAGVPNGLPPRKPYVYRGRQPLPPDQRARAEAALAEQASQPGGAARSSNGVCGTCGYRRKSNDHRRICGPQRVS